MLSTLRRVLDFEMTIAEWIGTAAMLAVPYVVVGLVWTIARTGQLASIAFWPAQMVSLVCAL
jgi:hypothetical protein